jgi:hypothetical protein
MSAAARIAVAVAFLSPLAVRALEPRFDHRDQQGVEVSLGYGRESVAVSGQPTWTGERPTLHVAWGFDVSGEGDELLFGSGVRLSGWSDPEGSRVLVSADSRYRGYFGTDELKTFFEVGLWVSLASRLSAGPLVGLGLAWDFDRTYGVFAGGQFATSLGQSRVAGFQASAGFQYRWE